ncbi:23S rRNA (uracil(1939)-C(5))-methyltransferase RlmD [Helcococcus kunzii]|uniref:23S rRNA (uracil(1939)-C(5))-methyltransferase RlmD n=1 Tax=Helcococcus kunzii TaxID=40091 RepID=UPI001BAE69C6|nr:23S rRNA (uracil(1939)-C(5))-methyltransferase RlmD [Helcococcus kunzii]QUY65608.1 23S rRNA (uracil(1939)-C(5))-methyltransferase RlmD [Helcococcus kunzii]
MAEKKVKIVDMVYPNYSIGEDEEGKKYRFKGGITGQEVIIHAGRKKAGYIKAKLMEIVEKSPLEINNFCENPNACSNCKFQNLEYSKELELKEKMISNLYKNIGWEKSIKLNPSPIIENYRNKMEYTFGDSYKGGPLVLGNHTIGKFYELTEYGGCQIAHPDFEVIREYTQNFFRERGFDFFHKTTHKGDLKYFVIRYSFYQKTFMLNLVTPTTEKLTQDILDEYISGFENIKIEGKIASFYHTVSDSIAAAIKPDKITKVWGEDHLTEKINGLIFNISPFSFFQPNPKGAENLYNKALELAGDINQKTVYDLYCGTGTISQIFAKKASKVIGVEIIEEAVEKARQNAEINGLSNLDFRANDVLAEIDNLTDNPDVVVLDPPRSGIHHDAIRKICKMEADKIVYISCNPETQVADLKVFTENGYTIEEIECFDQFPRTMHVEALVLMTRE